jgi:hypothetical protein
MTGTILSFEPIISDQSPENSVRIDRVISGVNTHTGAAVKATHTHTAPAPGNAGVVIPNKSYFTKKLETQ